MDATALKLRAVAPSSPGAGEASVEVRFRKTFEAAAIGIGICDLDGRVVEANSALARLLGYERTELVGIDLWKDAAKLLREESESLVLERRCQRRGGSEFWGRLTASLAVDDRGQPASLIVLLEDASERRHLEEHLRQAEKMAAIGQLSGGVAHDFNNLLTGILLYCDLLIPELELGGPLHRYVEEIRLATEQGAALTQQLLALARKEGLEPRAIDINEVATGMENLLRRLIGEQIELMTTLDAVGTVVADATQLRQIVLNLVLNARDALGPEEVPGGKIRMSTRLVQWPLAEVKSGREQPMPPHSAGKNHAQAKLPPQSAKTAPPGGPGLGRDTQRMYALKDSAPQAGDVNDRRPLAVLLTVEDNGCGMSAETCGHLFEPFFTTKKAGAGTGIGLGTVQRIVGELGGTVAVASAPGSGTRVEVFLPVDKNRDGFCQMAAAHDPEGRNFGAEVLNSKVEKK